MLVQLERSGAEVMLVQAAPLFRQRGLDLHALATGESIGLYAEQMAAAGFTLHHLPIRSPARHLLDFRRLLSQERFDVLHVHTERAFFWYALLGRMEGVRRIVRTVHSEFDFRGALWVERWFQRHAARRVLREVAVAPSLSVQKAEERIYGVGTTLIPNWTDPQRFCPPSDELTRSATRARLGLPESAVVLVSVGSCQDIKNHDAVIRALASIGESCPQARYLHIGAGELEQEERRLARDLGLAETVVFLGQCDDIPELLQASDVFVMPSSREGLPISCLEAMSCALPVVASDVSGLRDLVTDRVTGRLARSEDDLAGAMSALCGDQELRTAYGSAGREKVLREFSVEQSVEAYVRLYWGE